MWVRLQYLPCNSEKICLGSVVYGYGKMSRKPFLILCFALFLFSQPEAAEIDSFTIPDGHLPDSVEEINEVINKRLEEGIAAANEYKGDIAELEADAFCDEERLYRELRKAIFQSFSVNWGLKGYSLDTQLRELLHEQSYFVPLEDSIYRDISYFEGLSLNLKKLSGVVLLNGYPVGLDKVGHFFSEGWAYFEMTRADGDDIQKAMAWGWEKEEGMYGFTTTGIFSYADLVANFNGWRFWNRVRKTTDDPMHNWLINWLTQPYVSCETDIFESLRHLKRIREWRLSTPFDMAIFIDGGWDETNNCNRYATEEIAEKVAGRIEEVWPGYTCPADPKSCVEARSGYGELAQDLLNPRCLEIK